MEVSLRVGTQKRREARSLLSSLVLLLLSGAYCSQSYSQTPGTDRVPPASRAGKVVQNCRAQTRVTLFYDPSYRSLRYPGGDVPLQTGVCADVVVRGLRAAGVDLQKEVHEDMRAHFGAYPRLWNLRRPDRNIDHRRVANLMTYLKRKGCALPVSRNTASYRPGDIVAWQLPGGRLHIGVVSDTVSSVTGNPEVVHNISMGVRREDVLFAWPIIGHYRYFAR